jgi:MarR family transcriptional regulator, organic hydroperoxide resistance regulator
MSEPKEELGDVLEFMRLVWGMNHELESLSKRMASAFGVTGPQRLVLRIVGRMPGISAGHLANVLSVHPSTLTGVLRRLVERKIVERKPDPEDARRALLSLTAKGKTIDGLRTTGTVEAAVRKTLGRFDAPSLAVAATILQALADALASEKPRRVTTP